ncbi:MAG TPA: hypothetical protein VFP65_24600 [Anaeromyxobacteraceae bacterium]|nr:hypothetical protein [Anaeromyxobacteraceae bacterium]
MAALLAAAAPAGAEQLDASAPMAPVAAAAAPSAPRRQHVLGLSLDAGAPQGAGVSLHFRPWTFLRLGGGLLYNYVGYGARAEVSIQPSWIVAPALTLEAGHYFDANANQRVSQYTTVDEAFRPLLEQVGYSYANAQVGLEIGHPNWFVFFVRAGVGRIWLDVRGAERVAQTGQTGDVRVTSMGNPSLRLGTPNARVGFLFYFW